ncbi:hypothetical protein ABGB12_30325 [Actinocorallia sp. B10E7]|uniref:hypothetical protein n=1 Tax=Actinocorallia sp. B10E7 TaxID=3153558 RepID=UPI00325D1F67
MSEGFMITTRDIYDKLIELGSKVDSSLAAHERIREQVIDHEQRLRATERWRYTLPLSFLFAALSTVVSLLSSLTSV